MPLMNLNQVRGEQYPLLTRVVNGPAFPEFAGGFLFPDVPVKTRTGKIIEFNDDDFAVHSTDRAPGSAMRSVGVSYGNRDYQVRQNAIAGELPIEHLEEANANALPFDMQEETILKARQVLDLGLEIQHAALATDASKYPTNNTSVLSGSSQWSDPGSNPTTQVFDWRESVRRRIGKYPNRAVLGPKAFKAARTNPNITGQFRGVDTNSITADMLARIWELEEVKVGVSLKKDPVTGELVDIWEDVAVVAYVPKTITSKREPSYGYTYVLEGYPVAEEPYYDKKHRTWYFPLITERTPQFTGAVAGYLARNVSGSAS